MINWCWLFGHKLVVYGEPIIHEDEKLIEIDYDCLRCDHKTTYVGPWIPSKYQLNHE